MFLFFLCLMVFNSDLFFYLLLMESFHVICENLPLLVQDIIFFLGGMVINISR